MGLFDLFKKQPSTGNSTSLTRTNSPELLSFRFLFANPVNLDVDKILAEAQQYIKQIDLSKRDSPLLFSFPDFTLEAAEATLTAQCTIIEAETKSKKVELPEVAFQQNWHWLEASDMAKKCTHEILVSDLMSKTLSYKRRLHLYMCFYVAVCKATNPKAIYSLSAQKLINPADLISMWENTDNRILEAICNVRLFNIEGSNTGEIIMDTVGLHTIGLPDLQIRFSKLEANAIANLLWTYAYYIYENGDVIENGNTLEGIESGSKWVCEKQISLVAPERVVINIKPSNF